MSQNNHCPNYFSSEINSSSLKKKKKTAKLQHIPGVHASRGLRTGGDKDRGEAATCSRRVQARVRRAVDDRWRERAGAEARLFRGAQRVRASIESDECHHGTVPVAVPAQPARRNRGSVRGAMRIGLQMRGRDIGGGRGEGGRTGEALSGGGEGGSSDSSAERLASTSKCQRETPFPPPLSIMYPFISGFACEPRVKLPSVHRERRIRDRE